MRLAFDKAVVVITDDKTKFSFDTQVVDHLFYPADLNYLKIVEFKEQLKSKIKSTVLAYSKHDNPTFLKSFIQYKPKLTEETIGAAELILKKIEELDYKLNYSQSSKNEFNQWPERNFEDELNMLYSEFIDILLKTRLKEEFITLSKGEFEKQFLSFLIRNLPDIKLVGYLTNIGLLAEDFNSKKLEYVKSSWLSH